MDYQVVSAPSTTDTKDKWMGPGIYRLMSLVNQRYLSVDNTSVDNTDSLITDSYSQSPKQQWQIAYAGKRNLEKDPKENFVTEFFLINADSGKYLLGGGETPTMGVSPPTFGGESRWVLSNPRIQKADQTFDDRYIFYLYRGEHPKALANHGDKIQLIDYGEKKPDGGNEDEWYIVEDIAK